MAKQDELKSPGDKPEETEATRAATEALQKMAENLGDAPVAAGDAEELGAQEDEKKYSERATVNGIEMRVDYVFDTMDYEIYFPQINAGEKASKKGIMDQVIRISEDPKKARRAFEFAKQAASSEKDVEEVYLKVQDFCKELWDEE